ncbi:MAG: hypothetical protein ACI9RU_002321 [Litorivivens sp.]|jgi:hypothetical protein
MTCRRLAFIALIFMPLLGLAQCDFTSVTLTSTTGGWGYEMSWELHNLDQDVLATFLGLEDNETSEETVCLTDGCYFLFAMDAFGDGWNGGFVEIDVDGDILVYEMTQGGEDVFAFGVNTGGCVPIVLGCTNPEASNYNPIATADDGSCMTVQEVLGVQSITWMLESGPKDNRINWAIQNRGMDNANDEFDSEEEFLQMYTDDLMLAFTPGSGNEKKPFARYHNFFNLQAWWWPEAPSVDSGWSWTLLKGMRDSYFLPWADDEHGWATLFSTSKWGGGGGAGVQPETRTGDGLMYGMGWETLLHEFSHTMPQIPDEYSASGEWSGGECWEGPNTSGNMIRDSIPWRLWIDEGTELPTPYVEDNLNTIGAFEGALTNFFGCHRPTARGCIMGAGGFGEDYGQDLCPICIQRVICHLYKYVDVIENPMPESPGLNVLGGESISFSADIIKPEPNTQVYTWFLNGEIIAEGVEEVQVLFGECDDYELTLTVEDTISWVKFDPLYAHIYPRLFESHTWFIDQTEVLEYDLEASLSQMSANCAGTPSGEVAFDISGGMSDYSIFLDGESISNPHTNLTSGSYDYWVVDANGCGVEVTAEVGQEDLLEVTLCSAFEDGLWTVSAEGDGYEQDDLTFEWSTADTGPEITGQPDGEYTLIVATPSGCSVEESVSLSTPPGPLTVLQFSMPSSETEANGRIDLTITGGAPDYQIRWYDKLSADRTFPNEDNVSASGSEWDHVPVNAFDDDEWTKWLDWMANDAWLQFTFDEPTVITHYGIMSGDDVEERDPKDWLLEGSLDGNDWTVIDSQVNQDFPDRREWYRYGTDNQAAFSMYRLWIVENSGDGTVQLQDLELIGVDPLADFVYNSNEDDEISRNDLALGQYKYLVQDMNSNCAEEIVSIGTHAPFFVEGINVVQDGPCRVKIESPDAAYDYFWLSDEEASEILAIGNGFSPPQAGNYWVGAVDIETSGMSDNRPGFAVTMPGSPEISEVSEGILGVVDPAEELIYRWYLDDCGGDPIHEGTEFEAGTEEEQYYVSSWWAQPFPEPVDPASIPGLIVRMDAADLDGDGQVDDPQPATSSLYGWNFTPTGNLSDGGWFAYRGNHQNGLGVADFATMWLQGLEGSFSGYRTVFMAYMENGLSFEGSSPFFDLNNHMPISGNPSEQLYSDDVPATTLDGNTWLNGDLVDPMSTANPMDWCILGQTLTSDGSELYYSHTHWEGMIGEALFYDNELNEDQARGVSEYLRRKWIATADLEGIRTCVNWDGTSVGIEEIAESHLEVFPNPLASNSVLRVDLDQTAVLRLVSSNGKLLAEKNLNEGQQVVALERWMSSLTAGTYFLILQKANGETTAHQVVR